MTNANRNLNSIEKASNMLRKAQEYVPEGIKHGDLSAILMILTDISVSLANIADYFTEKNNKKEK